MNPVSRVFVFAIAGAVGTVGLFAGPPGGAGPAPAGRIVGYNPPSHFPSTIGLRPTAGGFTGINPGALPTRFGYGSSSYGSGGYGSRRGSQYGSQSGSRRDYRRVPVDYFFAPYYYPGLMYDSSGYDSEAYGAGGPPYGAPAYGGVDPATDSLAAGQGYLGQQIQQLSAQMDELKNAQQASQQTAASAAGAGPQQRAEPDAPPQPPVTLVLRNGQHLQVRNYAVMAGTFWDFTNPITKKIPVANIDIPASARATEAQGGEFPQLGQ